MTKRLASPAAVAAPVCDAGLREACMELAEGEPLAFIDGHDGAIMGVARVDGEARAVYDRDAIIRELMRRDGMDREGAAEFVDYNISGLFCGAPSPLLLERPADVVAPLRVRRAQPRLPEALSES